MNLKLYILQIGPPGDDGPHLLGPFDTPEQRETYARLHHYVVADGRYRFFNINAGGEVCVGNTFFPPRDGRT